MAERGKPLPITQRQDIKDVFNRHRSIRKAAAILEVSRNTIRKYCGKKKEGANGDGQ